MSNFMAGNNLPKFWEEIVELHWTFLFTEESRKKLDIRKILEDYLKEFLALVQHDRKFFLSETQEVLKSSIRDLDDFSVQKAITAFDWISQYANNLLTKPWRKEFRIVKMYSGFYQHEIKANLLNAEILFEAMGYQRFSDNILILNGPICPDQLTNVSRDAMTAYVELQIIKHIYAGLDAIDLNFSLLDILRYREKHTGSISQVVTALAYTVEEKRHRSRQKSLLADNYGCFVDVQPSSNYFATSSQHCTGQCQCELFQHFGPAFRQRTTAQSNGMCCVSEHCQQTPKHLVCNNMPKAVQYQNSHNHLGMSSENNGTHLPHMSHSRSLEHYSEASNRNLNILPQRHSFEHKLQECNTQQYYHPHQLKQEQERYQYQQQQQQQNYYHHVKQNQQNLYESPYDYIDGNSTGGGSSNVSYAAVATVNTPITRVSAGGGVGVNYNLNSSSASAYTHPYNISGNRVPLPLSISNQLHVYNNPDFSSYSTPQVPVYEPFPDQQIYTTASKVQQNHMINTNGTNFNQSSNGLQNRLLLKDSLEGRQPSFQTEQNKTIFKDTNVLQPAATTPHYNQSIETSHEIIDKYYSVCNGLQKTPPPPTTSSCQQHCISGNPSTNDGDVCVKPTLRDIGTQNDYNFEERGREVTTSMSCELANDQTCANNKCNRIGFSAHGNDPTAGYISYQEKTCSAQDLEKCKDINVQPLDMESLNINKDHTSCQNNSADKKISDHSDPNEIRSTKQLQPQETNDKNKSSGNENSLSANNPKEENAVQATNFNKKKLKSALKSTSSKTNAYNENYQSNRTTQRKTRDNKNFSKAMNNNNNNNNNNESLKSHIKETTQPQSSSSSATNPNKSLPNDTTNTTSHSAGIIVTSANEWSCSFCTFINPKGIKVCEMCCRTNENEIDASKALKGGTTIARNAPTCA